MYKALDTDAMYALVEWLETDLNPRPPNLSELNLFSI